MAAWKLKPEEVECRRCVNVSLLQFGCTCTRTVHDCLVPWCRLPNVLFSSQSMGRWFYGPVFAPPSHSTVAPILFFVRCKWPINHCPSYLRWQVTTRGGFNQDSMPDQVVSWMVATDQSTPCLVIRPSVTYFSFIQIIHREFCSSLIEISLVIVKQSSWACCLLSARQI